MRYYTDTYYSKDIRGNILFWKGEVNKEGHLIIYSGILRGKTKTIVNTHILGKNIGKSNETNKYTQAVKELKAKVVLKHRHGYKTVNDLGNDILILELEGDRLYQVLDTRLTVNKTDDDNKLKPMKAQPFKSNKMIYPAYAQPKVNGFRATLSWETIVSGKGMFETTEERAVFRTKEGHEYVLSHITNNLSKDYFMGIGGETLVFDGELYIPKTSLNNIKKCLPMKRLGSDKVSSPSGDPTKISFVVFDLAIEDYTQKQRFDIIQHSMYGNINTVEHDNMDRLNDVSIALLQTIIIYSDDDTKEWLEKYINNEWEGIVIRDMTAYYRFGSRPSTMLKLKKKKSVDCRIIDIIFKNETTTDEGKVRTFISFVLQNNINNNTFESTPEGDEATRLDYLHNKDGYIGKYANVIFYERSGVGNVPYHSNVTHIRDIADFDAKDILNE